MPRLARYPAYSSKTPPAPLRSSSVPNAWYPPAPLPRPNHREIACFGCYRWDARTARLTRPVSVHLWAVVAFDAISQPRPGTPGQDDARIAALKRHWMARYCHPRRRIHRHLAEIAHGVLRARALRQSAPPRPKAYRSLAPRCVRSSPVADATVWLRRAGVLRTLLARYPSPAADTAPCHPPHVLPLPLRARAPLCSRRRPKWFETGF